MELYSATILLNLPSYYSQPRDDEGKAEMELHHVSVAYVPHGCVQDCISPMAINVNLECLLPLTELNLQADEN